MLAKPLKPFREVLIDIFGSDFGPRPSDADRLREMRLRRESVPETKKSGETLKARTALS